MSIFNVIMIMILLISKINSVYYHFCGNKILRSNTRQLAGVLSLKFKLWISLWMIMLSWSSFAFYFHLVFLKLLSVWTLYISNLSLSCLTLNAMWAPKLLIVAYLFIMSTALSTFCGLLSLTSCLAVAYFWASELSNWVQAVQNMLTWIGLDHVVCFEEILNFPLITKIVYKSIVEIKFGLL